MINGIRPIERVNGDARQALREVLRERYEAGATIRQLQDATGRSYGSIHLLLKEAGVTFRSRGGATYLRSRPASGTPAEGPGR
ncbi:helix-turn-helix domain-containing protein [Actinomadura rupiterrae]|uniref:helix-turn-helix domain-containing protein n=1 Tax=Actinomadura rupiterrae TaxID=559627 RepID=UPI0020A414B4|nr:helix-turn-helix domain-containing protein [Actinomadura rupiterrae]MCP2337353.1 hypothetical protein [Actinomadura rupiterrae]